MANQFAKTQGLYKSGKFTVTRLDGTDQKPGDKHYNCFVFVLDINHDPHAIAALLAYAKSVRMSGYELLADDLEAEIMTAENRISNSFEQYQRLHNQY